MRYCTTSRAQLTILPKDKTKESSINLKNFCLKIVIHYVLNQQKNCSVKNIMYVIFNNVALLNMLFSCQTTCSRSQVKMLGHNRANEVVNLPLFPFR